MVQVGGRDKGRSQRPGPGAFKSISPALRVVVGAGPFVMPPASATPHTQRLRIVVLGYIVRGPVGGMAWHHLNYVLGLHQLGHEVLFVEDSDDSAWSCYNPATGESGADPGYGVQFAQEAFVRLGLPAAWAYWDQNTARWFGPRAGDADAWCRSADLLLSVSGINPLRPWTQGVPRRVFIDTDPVFTQIRHLTEPGARARAEAHNLHFTFGENVGRPGCTMPDDGFAWRPTRQPVALDAWPVVPPPPAADAAFSTVMLWESYPARDYGGRSYGMKSRSFADYRDLPRRSPAPLELALGGSGAPRDELRALGWRLADPLTVARGPWDYQAYLQRSRGEFGVAKHGYASSRCGWFSERTACYLASGRPAVVMDTGFRTWLPPGDGLFSFASPDEAVAALEAIVRAPERHARAARDVAAACFDARVVLGRLIDEAMHAPLA